MKKKIVFDIFKVYSNINWLFLRIGKFVVIVVYDSDVIGIVDDRCIKCYVEIVSIVLKLIFYRIKFNNIFGKIIVCF